MTGEEGPSALVVDDEPMVRRVLCLQLERLGWRVTEAADADSALASLRTLPATAVLVTDVNLAGGVSGFELARRGRQMRPTLPVLVLSGDAAGADAAGVLDRAPPPLAKPVSLRALERGMEDAVALAAAAGA